MIQVPRLCGKPARTLGITLNLIMVLCNVVLMISSHFVLSEYPNSNMFSCMMIVGSVGIVMGIIGSCGIGTEEERIVRCHASLTMAIMIAQGSAALTYWSLKDIIKPVNHKYELGLLIILIIMEGIQLIIIMMSLDIKF